jgi:predicted DNA-binding transcriptional regulator AlpA
MSDVAARTFVTAARVRDRYGISDMTLWRWLRDPKLSFPKPITINGRRYWREDVLSQWEGTRELSA